MVPFPRRLIILAGHYGSGKTNLAVQLALTLRETHDRVAVADLDIVNPYYRTKDAAARLQSAGIRLIASPFAGSNLDAPAMTSETGQIFDDPGLAAVADVGGDDRGALALGRYAAKIAALGADAQMWFVFNQRRPLSATPEDALAILREVEAAGHVPFTGLINNTNLGPDTAPDTVLSSLPVIAELSRLSGLPIIMTSVRRDLCPALTGQIDDLFPLDILQKAEWRL
ncbi:MAG: hypothetical protein LBT60_05570 [Oscillospiraceae bacterium]|jgi:energy-coupling factor transporter ATP-binding protein EcfA2|nr:hypothetical protein [Oscillospiraceae bacterium]